LLLPVVAVGLFFSLSELVLLALRVEPMARGVDRFVGFAGYARLFERGVGDDGRTILRTAANKLRFFNEQRFPALKGPGVRRVFTVGGSTTYGRPYDDRTSFSGWLRALLPAVDPSVRWEVVNAGGISYASYRVVRVLRELAAHEPDLFVVYTGHNEFLEQRAYGHLRDIPAPLRAASSLLGHSRTATVLRRAIDALRPASARDGSAPDPLGATVRPTLETFAGLEAYERDDPLRDAVLRHFERSLRRMVEIAGDAGAEILFVVPASNLRDCAPFKSQATDGLDEAGRRRSQAAASAARRALERGAFADALASTDPALDDDPRNADLLFLRGRALLALEREDAARAAFRAARDEDVCPLRALTSMQEIVRGVASETGTPLVDFPAIVQRDAEEAAGTSIAGDEAFLDHVHPTLALHRTLAVEIVNRMVDTGLARRTRAWDDPAVAAASRRVRESITDDDRARALGNLAQVLRWAGKVDEASELAARALSLGAEDATATIAATRALAQSALRDGDLTSAVRYIRDALEANPRSPVTHFQYGLMFLNLASRDLERGAAHLFATTVLNPELALARQTLGMAMAERGEYALAYRFLRSAERIAPDDAETRSALDRLVTILGDDANDLREAELVFEGEPGALPRSIGQVVRAPDGAHVRDGIWTEWHDNGEPRSLAIFRAGRAVGREVWWDRHGEVIETTEHAP
jgi:tetratricopeptide (TPR) repeat protein